MLSSQLGHGLLQLQLGVLLVITAGYLVQEIIEMSEALVAKLRFRALLLFRLRSDGVVVRLELLHDPYHYVLFVVEVSLI